MVTVVRLPKLGEIMKEAIIVEWLKREGDIVRKGEPIVNVETEKLTVDIEASADGKILKIYSNKGHSVPIGGALAAIGSDAEAPPDMEPIPTLADIPEERGELQAFQEGASVRIRATPAAKRAARERGLELGRISGSGDEGIVTSQDVFKYIEGQKAPAYEVLHVTGKRNTTAERLSKIAREAVTVTISTEVDTTKAVEVKRNLGNVSFSDIVIVAAAKALTKHVILNSTFVAGEIRLYKEVNIGLAVEVEGGLLVPVIRNAHTKDILEISRISFELIEKARTGRLMPSETEGGTFTISNLGMYGVQFFTPMLNPPQTGILGVGEISDRAFLTQENQVKTKPIVMLSLTFDHRVTDGAQAAKFLREIKWILEQRD